MLAVLAPGQGAQTPGFLSPWVEDAISLSLIQTWSEQIDLDLLRLGTTADAQEILLAIPSVRSPQLLWPKLLMAMLQ
jgi:malonyl CoA-acyl carrier protein transacylase